MSGLTRHIKFGLRLVCVGLFVSFGTAIAEPWLSTRYAQNCAGCHAPGRKNLPVADRRCTLSCQGCHVSPSGGGLRSFYGKWNEDRWLKTVYSQALGQGQAPTAPITLQKYGPKKKNAYAKGKKAPKGGFDLVELKGIPADGKESLWDRRDGLEKLTSSDRAEFEYQIPEGDPYRQMDLNKIDAGADVRWQWRRGTTSASSADADGNLTEGDPEKVWSSFPMQVEAQFGWRPFHRKLRFVYELRAQQGPSQKNNPDTFGAAAGRRSLYAMVEDLPYNLYVQGGYYRPLFGYYTPDHTFLPQLMMSNAIGIPAYSQQFLTYSFGGSPNLPYVNMHYIARDVSLGRSRPLSGFAGNFGVRFVTKGISGNYSIWKLTDESLPNGKSNAKEYLFQSIFGSIQVGRLTYSLDLTSLERNDPLVDLRRGGVYSMDAYFQLFRANYANAQYSYSNCATDLTVGNATQMRFGLRSFLTAGTDFTMHYEIEDETRRAPNGAETLTKRSGLVGQIHLFM